MKNDLFDLLAVPTGIDKELAIDTILINCWPFDLIYPDADIMKAEIGRFAARRTREWERLLLTTTVEYDPIENYDRKEEWTDTDTGTDSTVRNSETSGSFSDSGGTTSTPGSTTTAETSASAFNASSMKGTEKTVTTLGGADSTENHNSGTDSVKMKGGDTLTRSMTHRREGRAHGNIGVTTNQQMLEAERQVVMFNVYNQIATDFKSEFCVMKYYF